ncbi:hypothetical protein QBC44DRAFT_367269 [Cladorrhinum sp. PSN332]|nr:hypothetical protein QBC44DRAFT_367269 [Cladorrhinum sp. PSN332]
MAVTAVLLLWALLCARESISVPHHKPLPRQANSVLDPKVKLRRAFHSSAVLNGWLYVDGGEFSSSTGGTVVYQYADTIASIDLRKDFTNDSVALRSTTKPAETPSLKNGGIWVDHNNSILYTGFAGTESSFGDDIKYPQGLWSFTPDGTGGGFWENLNKTADPSFVDLPRPYMGQVASGNGLGFFLGGFVGNESGKYTALSSLTTYNLASHELTNLTVTGVSNRGLEQMGGMIYIPNFGNQGILVNMGGDQDGRVEADDLISFRRIQVYDPENQRWFEQKATGEIPQPRKEFCITGAASTNRTYEILVYAGYDGELGSAAIPYDSAFVLTIPGFYWVRAQYTPANPRHGLTCNLVSGGQVLIIGGVDSTQRNTGDSEDDYHDVFDTPDPFLTGLAVFDLTRLRFQSSYTAKQEPYKAAPEIKDYYNTRGNKPESGFASPALEALFSVQKFDDPASSTSSAEAIARKSNAGAIAGGVVGGVGGLAMVIWLALCLRRRRSRTQEPESHIVSPARDLALPRVARSVACEAIHDKQMAPAAGKKPERHEMSATAAQRVPKTPIPPRPELPSQWPDRKSETTYEGRQEMPAQDMRVAKAGLPSDSIKPGMGGAPAQEVIAELPGVTPPAELSGHGRQISELGERISEHGQAADAPPEERTKREKNRMNAFKFPDSFDSCAYDGSGVDAGTPGVSPGHGPRAGAVGDGGGDGGGG